MVRNPGRTHFLISRTESSHNVLGFSSRPLGFWNSEKSKNMRVLFEDIARKQHLDPLIPETWYPMSANSVKLLKVLQYFVREN